MKSLLQAYNLTGDHKPYLKAEKHRILEASGFVQGGRVNGNLNVARAIDTSRLFSLCVTRCGEKRQFVYVLIFLFTLISGDLELKQNKSLPAKKQAVTANPKLNTVCSILLLYYGWSNY